ncbi:MAG: hypothetical protein GW949_01975 [Spirochaetales bacterium]|nr:hypothetical protein [Spirochaetales bacterium]
MEKLLGLFENPHRALPMIHIAGSKGKGSVATLLARGIGALGKKVGLYRSPHIVDYRERITLGGDFFPEAIYIEKIQYLRNTLARTPKAFEGEPTTFELLTLLAFLLFRDENCDLAVIEVGLGGRLDATNLVIPEASIVTTLELEHTDILGPTMTHIAKEKAGIIKSGVPVFSFPQNPEALIVLETVSAEKGCRLTFPLGKNAEQFGVNHLSQEVSLTWEGSTTNFEGETWESVVPGKIHLFNTIFSARILDFLFGPSEKYRWFRALAECRIPGRMEVRFLPDTRAPIILDGAHTEESARLLVENLRSLTPGGFVLVLGIVEGKNSEGILRTLGSRAREIWITTPGTFKVSNPPSLAARAQELFVGSPAVYLELDTIQAIEKGLQSRKEKDCPLVISGSFYLLGEASRWLLK